MHTDMTFATDKTLNINQIHLTSSLLFSVFVCLSLLFKREIWPRTQLTLYFPDKESKKKIINKDFYQTRYVSVYDLLYINSFRRFHVVALNCVLYVIRWRLKFFKKSPYPFLNEKHKQAVVHVLTPR